MSNRSDSLSNIMTGMGGKADPESYFGLNRQYSEISEHILEELIRQFPLLRKIVETFPNMMTARFGIPTFGGDKLEESLPDRLKNKLNRLKSSSRFNEYRGMADAFNTCAKFANLYGNAAAIMVCDDSKDLAQPIDFTKLNKVSGLYILNNYDLYPDLSSRGFLNQFTHFNFFRSWEGIGHNSKLHKSRVLWFRAVELGANTLASRNGKDDGLIVGILSNFLGYETGVKALNRMIINSSQKRHGIRGLYSEMEEKGEEYERFVATRLQLNERSSSVYNTLLFDPEKEEIDFLERGNLSDVNEAFNNILTNLVANTKYTKAQLTGEFVGGILTAGSDTERQQINMAVLQEQRSQLNTQALKLCETILRSGEFDRTNPDNVNFDWKWLPYSLPTSSELATLKQTYVSMALSANSIEPRVALNILIDLFKGSEFSEEINLRPELLAELEKLITGIEEPGALVL